MDYAMNILLHEVVTIENHIKRIKQINIDEGRPPGATYNTNILEQNKAELEKAIEILKNYEN